MYFSNLCLGFPLLLFPATIPCIIVFSQPLCRVTWAKYLSLSCHNNYLASSLVDEVCLISNSWCDEVSRVYVISCGSTIIYSISPYLSLCFLTSLAIASRYFMPNETTSSLLSIWFVMNVLKYSSQSICERQ